MSFKSARAMAGLSVKEVAKALNVSSAAIYMWETSSMYPRPSKLSKIAKLYGCTIDELFANDAK